MEPETLDTIIEGVKVGSIIVGGSIAMLGTIFGGTIGIMKVLERRYAVKQLMPFYEEGKLETKPTIFNIYRITKLF